MNNPRSSDIFQPGDLLNNTYRIESILGRGGTSEVYKARSEISGRVMAIKALRAEYASNDDFLALMTREEDVREIQHDAVVRYFDTQRMADGVVYLVMDHVDGPGLDQKLAEGGMPASELMIVGETVGAGLAAAHARNIIHRDLSPDNIILRHGRPSQAVIIDFGIAKDTNPGAETIVGNEFAGKYAYAAPEQLSGHADVRSDIYALGALLLATFRGKKPDVGSNPMEVVERKALPLDVEGVPEPLRGLISRMCEPNADNRFQSAEELIAAFKGETDLSQNIAAPKHLDTDLDDATVIAPLTSNSVASRQLELGDEVMGVPSDIRPATRAKSKERAGAPVLALLLLVLVGGAGTAYFVGALDKVVGPRYPVADPFALIVEKASNGGPVRAIGNVPSPETETSIVGKIEALGGVADLTLATGEIPEDWGESVLALIDNILDMEEFRLVVDGTRIGVSGLASTRDQQDAVRSFISTSVPESLNVTADIALGPRFLNPDQVAPILEDWADCGRLHLTTPPPIGYGLNDTIIVTGRYADEATRTIVRDEISAIAGDRIVRVEGEVLNPALCQIDSVLPKAASGGFDIRMGYGDRADINPSGRYKAGDNPTIDIRIPDEQKEGYIWVSIVDVQGTVYHLLPYIGEKDNSLASLRTRADADGFVRVAFGTTEANGRLNFNVDGSTPGKSKILVLFSRQPLFGQLRPGTESAASYADAIVAAQERGELNVSSLDSAFLITEE